MNSTTNQRLAQLIWNIADDVLLDLYVRGKYRDVILPMTVLRRLDSVLETTKQKVRSTKQTLDAAQIVHQDAALLPLQLAGQLPALWVTKCDHWFAEPWRGPIDELSDPAVRAA